MLLFSYCSSEPQHAILFGNTQRAAPHIKSFTLRTKYICVYQTKSISVIPWNLFNFFSSFQNHFNTSHNVYAFFVVCFCASFFSSFCVFLSHFLVSSLSFFSLAFGRLRLRGCMCVRHECRWQKSSRIVGWHCHRNNSMTIRGYIIIIQQLPGNRYRAKCE